MPSRKASSRSARRRAGAERRRAAQDVLLQAPLGLVEQGAQEPLAVAEAAEQRALADAGGARDVVHGDRLHAALGEQPGRRLQHARAVARGVRALGPRRAGEGELGAVHGTSVA